MISKEELTARLQFRRAALEEARAAYLALLNGQVQSYTIGSRNLTRLDLGDLWDIIVGMEREVDSLAAALRGGKQRKAVGVVPRDW